MHVVQAAGLELVERVVDGVLQVGRAGQPGTERVDEHRQLGPRAAAVRAADVRQHAFGDGPVTGDLGPERVGQPAIGRGDRARGQQRQRGRGDRARGGTGTPATAGGGPHVRTETTRRNVNAADSRADVERTTTRCAMTNDAVTPADVTTGSPGAEERR